MRALKKLPPPPINVRYTNYFFPENVFILNLLFWEMVGIGSLSAGKSKISTMQWGYGWGGGRGWMGVEGYNTGGRGPGSR